MQKLVIRECPLNDDTLYLADTDKVFSGNYVAILEQFSFANSWSDKKQIKRFRKMDTLYKYLEKSYPEYDSGTLVFQA